MSSVDGRSLAGAASVAWSAGRKYSWETETVLTLRRGVTSKLRAWCTFHKIRDSAVVAANDDDGSSDCDSLLQRYRRHRRSSTTVAPMALNYVSNSLMRAKIFSNR